MKTTENNSPSEILFDFISKYSAKEPSCSRILIYRSAEQLLKLDGEYGKELGYLANQLEAVENATVKLALKFRKERS